MYRVTAQHHTTPHTQGQEAQVEYYLPSVLRLTGIVPEVYGSDVRQLMTERCAVRPGPRFQKIKDMAAAVLRPFKELGALWGCAAAPGFVIENARQFDIPTIEQSKSWSKTGTSWRFDIDRRPGNENPTTGCVENVVPVKKVLVACPKGAKASWADINRFMGNSIKHFGNASAPTEFRQCDMDRFAKADVNSVFAKYKSNPDCYLFVTDETNDPAYNAAKAGAMSLGVPCQVIRTSSFQGSKTKSVCNNVAAQIHTKAGNLIWKKKGCSFPGTMAVGIAQSHAGDGSGRGERKSVMSIASSYDTELKAYTTDRTIIDAGVTIAKSLAAPFRKQLEFFKSKNKGKYPAEIVFFREGGSEGEIPLIMELEVAALRQVLVDLGAKANIVFFLVLRNSHMRVAAIDGFIEGNIRKATVSKAPMLGTVMDTGVVNPRGMEFYLLSQEANIGSPQSIKYKCLVFEGKTLHPDKYQCMANDLACLYFNWTGPVALPAPIMYAQRDAKLTGQCLLQNDGTLVDLPDAVKVGVPLV